jgi:hypothetical protein
MNGAGSARIRFRGNFFGGLKHGRIIASQNVKVGGWKTRTKLPSGLIEYRGPDADHQRLTFKTPPPPARWRLRLRGTDIDATGFVRGCMTLNAVDSGPTGQYRIGVSGDLHPWPRDARTRALGSGC